MGFKSGVILCDWEVCAAHVGGILGHMYIEESMVHTHTHTHTHTRHVYIAHLYTPVIPTCLHANALAPCAQSFTHTHTHIHTHARTHTRSHTHTCTHTYTHTYTHTHTHLRTQFKVLMLLIDVAVHVPTGLLWFASFSFSADQWRKTPYKNSFPILYINYSNAVVAFSFFCTLLWVSGGS